MSQSKDNAQSQEKETKVAPQLRHASGGGSESQEKLSFNERILRNIEETKPTRWIRFGLVSLIWILFCIWLDNLWLLFVLLLLFDIYISGIIPFTFWKHHKSKTVRRVGGWVDSIIYALILVYFTFAYIGQNYKIPSSSLEKTLLVGDYLWVNKLTYGPRVPQTPLHFPLAESEVFGVKSYLDFLQVDYHRLPGLRNVERYDIVVFNAPHMDTITTKVQEPDYYRLVYELENNPDNQIADGRKYIADHPEQFGEVIWRPVDRRVHYVKRAVGLPGDVLQIINDTVYINGTALKEPVNIQHNYIVPLKNGMAFTEDDWTALGISMDDRSEPIINENFPWPFYNLPLTGAMLKQVSGMSQIAEKPIRVSELEGGFNYGLFPMAGNFNWTLQNMGKIWIPRQGSTLKLTTANLPIYRRVIETYEGNKVEVKGEEIFINGKKAETYTFKMDYYWMMGDNRDNSADSRFWGFVPEDHIVGTPATVLISFDKDKSWLNKVRWNRIFKTPNPDK